MYGRKVLFIKIYHGLNQVPSNHFVHDAISYNQVMHNPISRIPCMDSGARASADRKFNLANLKTRSPAQFPLLLLSASKINNYGSNNSGQFKQSHDHTKFLVEQRRCTMVGLLKVICLGLRWGGDGDRA